MSVTEPFIIQKPGHPANAYPTRAAYKPEAIVLHTMVGSLAGCDAWFANPEAKAGAHFGVGANGAVHQYYPLTAAPWANGRVEQPVTARLVRENAGINPNYWTVSIEHEDGGEPGRALTAAQFAASTRLAAWLWASCVLPAGARGVPALPDRDHILSHSDISPQSRPHCNGWGEERMAAYIAQVRRLLGEAPAPTPAPDPRGMSAEWQLRVGIAEALTDAVRGLLQPVLPAGTALGSARSTALEVVRLVDQAGGG